jgi:hypothetical protein
LSALAHDDYLIHALRFLFLEEVQLDVSIAHCRKIVESRFPLKLEIMTKYGTRKRRLREILECEFNDVLRHSSFIDTSDLKGIEENGETSLKARDFLSNLGFPKWMYYCKREKKQMKVCLSIYCSEATEAVVSHLEKFSSNNCDNISIYLSKNPEVIELSWRGAYNYVNRPFVIQSSSSLSNNWLDNGDEDDGFNFDFSSATTCEYTDVDLSELYKVKREFSKEERKAILFGNKRISY